MAPLLPDVVGRLSADITPFCAVEGLSFRGLADSAEGPWRNFFVGLVGSVAAHEDDILWPNQVREGEHRVGARGGGAAAPLLLPSLLPPLLLQAARWARLPTGGAGWLEQSL